jgi:hypothetical protein
MFKMLAWTGVTMQATMLEFVFHSQDGRGVWSVVALLFASIILVGVLSRVSRIAISLVICAAIVNGSGWVWNWYGTVSFFDEVARLACTFALTLAIGTAAWVYGAIDVHPGSLSFTSLAVLIATGLGMTWEATLGPCLSTVHLSISSDVMMTAAGSAAAGWFAGKIV